MKFLVVLSGGQDSTTCLFWVKRNYPYSEVHAITFDYNQRHKIEIDAAKKIAAMANVASHRIVTLGSVLEGTSPLTNQTEQLETYSSYEEMDQIIGDRVEKTFVPMRNQLFLTIAMNRAVVLGCRYIVTGVCEQDNANYPDCRQEFLYDLWRASGSALGSPAPEILAPLIRLTKAESVKLAHKLPGCWDALAYSHTSYDGTYPPVSKDHASVLRAQGFREAGLPDPLVCRAVSEGLMVYPETENYDAVR